MNQNDQAIQAYLDAIVDERAFCPGKLRHIDAPGDPPVSRDCAVRDRCRLYRHAPRIAMQWSSVGHADKGCRPFEFWQIEKQSQEENSREWLITMHGIERRVMGKDPFVAAINMFLELSREGIRLPNEVIMEKQFTFREP